MHERLPLRFGWILILMAVAAAVTLALLRYRLDGNRTVDLVLDGREHRAYARKEGLAYPDLLRRMKEAGATSVSVAEHDLRSMQAEGWLEALSGAELRRLAASGSLAPAAVELARSRQISDAYTYVLTDRADVRERILAKVDRTRVREAAPGVLEILYGKDKVSQLTFGFDMAEVQAVRESGLRPVPRPGNEPTAGENGVRSLFAQLKQLFPEARLVIFQGSEAVGYPDALAATAEELGAAGILMGIVEKPDGTGYFVQKGFERLAGRLDYRVARVSGEINAARRGAHVLYVKPPERQDAVAALQAAAGDLKAQGFQLGTTEGFRYVRVGRTLQVALTLGVAGALLLILGSLVQLNTRGWLGVGVLLGLGAVSWPYVYPGALPTVALMSLAALPAAAFCLSLGPPGGRDAPPAYRSALFAASFLVLGAAGGLIFEALRGTPAMLLGIVAGPPGLGAVAAALTLSLGGYAWTTRHAWDLRAPVTLGNAVLALALLAAAAMAYMLPLWAPVLVGAAALQSLRGSARTVSLAAALCGAVALAQSPVAGLVAGAAGALVGIALDRYVTHLSVTGRLEPWPGRGRETA